MKTCHVVMRQIQLRDGSQVQFPVGAFTDKNDALKETENTAARLNGMNPSVIAALKFIGVEGIGHSVLEMPLVHGSGLVIAGVGTLNGSAG